METVTAATIQDLIATGRIVEARTLLAVGSSSLSAEERQACDLELNQRLAKAEALVAQAEAMEGAGKTEEAKALYEAVVSFAVDFPGIREHIRRTDEALLLTQAVQRRSRRIRESLPSREGSATKRIMPIVGAVLAIGLGAVVLWVAPNTPHSPPSSSPVRSTTEQPVQVEAGQPVNGPPASSAPPAASSTPPEPAATNNPAPPPVPMENPLPQAVAHQGAPKPAEPEPAPPETLPSPEPTPPSVVEQPQSPPAPLPRSEHPAAIEPHQRVAAPAEPQQPDLYTVQVGDSLSLIAERRFCYQPAWQQIYQLNRERITDPRKLQPGMLLHLTGIATRCPAVP